MFPIAALYSGILAIIFILLSINVVRGRYQTECSIGDGGDDRLRRRIRAQGNFAEYVPIALILLFLLEAHNVSHLTLHILGILLIISRLLHAFSLLFAEPCGERNGKPCFAFRMLGMVLTFGVLGFMACYAIYIALYALAIVT